MVHQKEKQEQKRVSGSNNTTFPAAVSPDAEDWSGPLLLLDNIDFDH